MTLKFSQSVIEPFVTSEGWSAVPLEHIRQDGHKALDAISGARLEKRTLVDIRSFGEANYLPHGKPRHAACCPQASDRDGVLTSSARRAAAHRLLPLHSRRR